MPLITGNASCQWIVWLVDERMHDFWCSNRSSLIIDVARCDFFLSLSLSLSLSLYSISYNGIYIELVHYAIISSQALLVVLSLAPPFQLSLMNQ